MLFWFWNNMNILNILGKLFLLHIVLNSVCKPPLNLYLLIFDRMFLVFLFVFNAQRMNLFMFHKHFLQPPGTSSFYFVNKKNKPKHECFPLSV